jgi:hypothetical protein
LLVAHNEPNEVNVFAPPFVGPLSLELVTRGPRIINTTELWTVVEYRFKANSPGIFSFDAFTVITPGVQVMIDPFEVTVLQSPAAPQSAAAGQSYRLVWEGIPSGLVIGESAVLSLRVSGWNPTQFQPEAPFPQAYVPPVPPGHILESLPLGREKRSAGIVLELRLVPLEAVPFVIEGRRLSSNAAEGTGPVFEIPPLRIPVRRAQESPAVGQEANEAAQGSLPFPPLEAAAAEYNAIYEKYATECEVVYAGAKDLWGSACFAEALAMLRQNERDRPSGKLVAVIRRGAEQALGLTGTHDERRDLIMKLWVLIGRYRPAVLRETSLRRIPDQAGEELILLGEGQPVLVLRGGTNQIKWLHIITGDNSKISGWVPENNVIFY